MTRLLAIDGLNIVRRVYEANPAPDSEDKAAAAIRNAVSSFMKLLAAHEPTHVLPAFEHGGHTWRHDLHPAYRGSHSPMPAVLAERLPDLFDRLDALGIKPVSVAGVEAGDVIATAVLRWLGEGRGEAVIASTDKRLHGLVAQGAVLWDHFKGEWHDAAWVNARFGVPPEMLADLLALCGDAADGIPGVSKVGQKTGARLLQSYKSLEGIMGGAGILMTPLGTRLRAEKSQAYLSRELVSLKTDVQIGVTWKTLAFANFS